MPRLIKGVWLIPLNSSEESFEIGFIKSFDRGNSDIKFDTKSWIVAIIRTLSDV